MPISEHAKDVRRMLIRLGWDRIRTTGELRQAVEHFQGAVVIGGRLTVDGIAGPITTARLRACVGRLDDKLPTASAHFSFTEFRCKCGGRFTSCARIWVKRDLIIALEKYRKELKAGVSIVSGCRCPGHNKYVGGAIASRHMVGDAADFPPIKSKQWFIDRGLFRGRGWNHSPTSHPVRHGDMGPVRTWMYS